MNLALRLPLVYSYLPTSHDTKKRLIEYEFYRDRGNAVAQHMNLPVLELSSVLTSTQNGEEIFYFYNGAGNIFSCDLQKGLWKELPPLLPPNSKYYLRSVNCGGQLLVVVLHELEECATIRIWKLNSTSSEWVEVLAMPPAMSKEYYGKNAMISCVGYGNLVMICISYGSVQRAVLCNIHEKTSMKLPRCYVPGSRRVRKLEMAFPFEPRLEVSV